MSIVTSPLLLRYGQEIRKLWDAEPRVHDFVYPMSLNDNVRVAAWATSPAHNAMVHVLIITGDLSTYMQVRRSGLTTRAKTAPTRIADFVRWYRAYPGDRKQFPRSVK